MKAAAHKHCATSCLSPFLRSGPISTRIENGRERLSRFSGGSSLFLHRPTPYLALLLPPRPLPLLVPAATIDVRPASPCIHLLGFPSTMDRPSNPPTQRSHAPTRDDYYSAPAYLNSNSNPNSNRLPSLANLVTGQ
ncbi:hypothetical protein VDGE_30562 [Verticillium dahliae]|uniref:Uncharacterized protein n=1 Tax=Verticillium dahliae TaxID=27337 RepID=A0A444RQ72_VERDA|nr:hypothetical protein VDGE_30562 [Verticillium dahliae]